MYFGIYVYTHSTYYLKENICNAFIIIENNRVNIYASLTMTLQYKLKKFVASQIHFL